MSTKAKTAPDETIKSEVSEVMETEIITSTSVNEQTSIVKDEFADASFVDPNARLPKIQALRGVTPDLCGYFISIDEMAKAGWLNFDEVADRLVTYTYESSGNTANGLLLKSPRMLVNPRSNLLGYDRATSTDSEQLVILGNWKREYKEDENIGNLQMFEILLLSQDNRPLHSVPLSYIARGANQASFSSHWQQLCQTVTNCHAIANWIAARPKDARFNSLCVFSFDTARELVGKKQKSATCRVVEHDVPTMQNWKSYFLGYDAGLKEQIWGGLQPSLPMITPAQTPALPVAHEEDIAF